MKTTKFQPTPEQLEAVKTFAAIHGRTWKHELRLQWQYAGEKGTSYGSGYARQPWGCYLQQLRNSDGGFRWLEKFSIEKPS